jgi:hypothetical protein
MYNGNNIKSKKFYRATIPISRTGLAGEVPQGKFFFPDLPELKNKTICGMEAHIGGLDVVATDFPLRILSLNQRITALPPQISGAAFITLVNEKNSEIITQYPLFALANKNIPPAPNFSKIIPIRAKINPPKCFVELPNIGVAPYTTFYFAVTITFYLL